MTDGFDQNLLELRKLQALLATCLHPKRQKPSRHHQSERLEGYSEIPLDLLMDQDRTSKPASGNFFGAIAPKLPTLRVRDLLKHFFKDDCRSFTCEHCDDKSDGNAIYKSRLVKMPQVLVLHLNRQVL